MTPPQEERIYTVSAGLRSAEPARSLIQALEEQGTPPNAIDLIDPGAGADRSGTRERPVLFGDLARSVLLGAVIGAAIGIGLGWMLALATDVELPVGALLGGIFGSAIGGAAGGVSVVKYASPAWREAQHTGDPEGEPEMVAVTVRHPDASVIDRAEQVFSRHEDVVSIRRAEI